MTLLLAKIIGLLVLAALFGAWLARWWIMRHYEDVTLQYTSLQSDWASWRKSLDNRLSPAGRSGIDLAPLLARLDAIESAIARMQLSREAAPSPPPTPEPTRRRVIDVGDVQDVDDAKISP